MHYETGSASSADNESPHQMQFRVEYSSSLLNLLFIRLSWQLNAVVQLSELLPAPQHGKSVVSSSASSEEWGHRWNWAWDQPGGSTALSDTVCFSHQSAPSLGWIERDA